MRYCLKEFKQGVNYNARVIMDDYLVVLANGRHVSTQDDSTYGQFEAPKTSLLAFKLLGCTGRQ